MPTIKDFDSKTTLTTKKSTGEKVAARRKKSPYEVPPRKIQMEALMHKSRFRPSKAKSDITQPEASNAAPEAKVPITTTTTTTTTTTEATEATDVAPEEVKPEVSQPEEVSTTAETVNDKDDDDDDGSEEMDMNETPAEDVSKEMVPDEESDMSEMPETKTDGPDNEAAAAAAAEEETTATPEIMPTDRKEPEEYSTEYYVNGYCQRKDHTEQYYAQDELSNEYYWRDSVGAQIYANRAKVIDGVMYRVEFPALKNGEAKYIKDREGKPRYPVNLDTQAVVFPQHPHSHEEMYLTDKNGEIYYPENKFGQQFYRKDLEGNEVPISNMYAQFPNGTQIYPKKANGDQFYLTRDKVEIPAVTRHENKTFRYYAKRANGDEIYPRMYLDEEDYELNRYDSMEEN